jgi:DNA-binding CsgD family transcriptional regulator
VVDERRAVQQRRSAILAWRHGGSRAAIDEALAVTDVSGDAFERRQAQCFNGLLAAMEGDLTTAIDVVVPLIDEARATHDTTTLPLALAALSMATLYSGDPTNSRTFADEAARVSDESGSPWAPTAFAARAMVAFCEGDLGTLATMVHSFQRASAAMGLATDDLVPWLAWGYALAGDVPKAREALDGMTAAPTTFVDAVRELAEAAIARMSGRFDLAEDHAHGALAAARRGPLHTIEVDCVELLAGLAVDLESYDEAVRLLATCRARRHVNGYARPSVLQPGVDAAEQVLVETVGIERYETLSRAGAAMSWAQAIDYATRGRGERKRPSAGWASLTPAERAVVDLVAEGLTNQQVAERLFVARRTVGTHLTHIFTKLGVANRAELAAGAIRRRL